MKNITLTDIIELGKKINTVDFMPFNDIVIEIKLPYENYLLIDEFLFFKNNPDLSKSDYIPNEIVELILDKIIIRLVYEKD